MLKNNQAVTIKTFTPTGTIVARKFFGEGEAEEVQYLVEFANAEGEVGTRWFTEAELEVLQ